MGDQNSLKNSDYRVYRHHPGHRGRLFIIFLSSLEQVSGYFILPEMAPIAAGLVIRAKNTECIVPSVARFPLHEKAGITLTEMLRNNLEGCIVLR